MRTENGLKSSNEFYVGYDSLTGTVIPETMYRHKDDTDGCMQHLYGENWKETNKYLIIKKCEVIVHESSNQG